MKKNHIIATLAAATTFAFAGTPALATPTMPAGETLYTIQYAQGIDTFALLGSVDADGIVTPIGEQNSLVNEVRDADFDWAHNVAYVLGVDEGQCVVWSVNLDTGAFTNLWEVLDASGESMTWCDSLMVAGSDASEIWVSGTDNNNNVTNTIYNRETGAFIETTAENDVWQSMEYFESDNVTTYFFDSDENDDGGRFYNAVNDTPVWTTGYNNIHSLSYTENGELWFTNWADTITVGRISATTGEVDLLTDNLRYANGDPWGTDAIFWARSESDGLADTGFEFSGISLTGAMLITLGAVVAIRRRARG